MKIWIIKRPINRVNPSKTFPHLTAWNINLDDFDSNEEYEKAYFAKQHSNGLLRLCNFGCGISINLIVNGVEYGNMWADDRGNDNGIAPWLRNNKERLNFLNWYELWLDESIEKLKL